MQLGRHATLVPTRPCWRIHVDGEGDDMTTTDATSSSTPLTERPAWIALQDHYREVEPVHLRTLFAEDPTRGERLVAEGAGLFLDYSKNRVTDETPRLLVRLAEESDLRGRIEAMFGGEKINT